MDKGYILRQLEDLAVKVGLDIDSEIISKVIDISNFKVFKKGDLVARTGDTASISGIVMNGIVRSYYVDSDGNDISQFFAAEGNLCVEEGLMGFERVIANWEAITESTVMLFDASAVKEIIMGDEKMKALWIGLLESGMRYKISRENGFLTKNATERYLQFRNEYPNIYARVPQQYLATYLGIKPESLSRIKSALKDDIKEN